MKFVPREYQQRAIDFAMEKKRCNLWMEMGLGKTVVALTVVDNLKILGEARKVLVIAPLRVATNTWPNEIQKWNHTQKYTISLITGSEENRIKALLQEADIYIINYENIIWLINSYIKKWNFDVVIADESSKLKNPSAKRFKKLKKVVKQPKYWINLTGTPATNGLLNLWSQLYLIDQGERLGRTFPSYRERWFKSDYMGYKWTPFDWSSDQIQDKCKDVSLSLSTKDYLQLPKFTLQEVEIVLPDPLMSLYAQLEKEMYFELGNLEINTFTAAALTMKCRQFVNGAIYTTKGDSSVYSEIHDLKLKALEEIVDESNGEPLLIAYNFKCDAERIKKKFKQAKLISEIKGNVEKKWNNGEIPMLLMYATADAHGLNLQQGGRIGVWFGGTWDLDAWMQFQARLDRSGQDRPGFIYPIICKDTIDTRMMERVRTKKTVHECLMEAAKCV